MNLRKLTSFPEINAALRSNLRDVPRMVSCGSIDIASTDEFTVTHTLGETPDFYITNSWGGGVVVEASESSRRKWSSSQITLSATATGSITLIVGKL